MVVGVILFLCKNTTCITSMSTWCQFRNLRLYTALQNLSLGQITLHHRASEALVSSSIELDIFWDESKRAYISDSNFRERCAALSAQSLGRWISSIHASGVGIWRRLRKRLPPYSSSSTSLEVPARKWRCSVVGGRQVLVTFGTCASTLG